MQYIKSVALALRCIFITVRFTSAEHIALIVATLVFVDLGFIQSKEKFWMLILPSTRLFTMLWKQKRKNRLKNARIKLYVISRYNWLSDTSVN